MGWLVIQNFSDLNAPIKSFDYRLFVREFAAFYMCLHSIIISWCMIGTAAKEIGLETIRNTKNTVKIILKSLPKL